MAETPTPPAQLATELERVTAAFQDDRKPITASERSKAVSLATSAMGVHSLTARGDDSVVQAINRTPEPHHLAAMGLARAIARHDGPAPDNPFQHSQLAKVYENERAHAAFLAKPAGRWIVQQWDEGRGIYADQLQTNSAATADAMFRSSPELRVIDTRINDVAADYPRASHSEPRGEATYSMRSQFQMQAHEELARKDGRADAQKRDAVVALAFLQANSPTERREAAEKHPQLAQAFALEASYVHVAKRISNEAAQDAFMDKMRSNITSDLAHGRPLASVQLRDSGNAKQAVQLQDRDADRGR